MGILQNAVRSITIETDLLPTITLENPLEGGGAPNPVLTLLKPRITINGDFGQSVFEPYGSPGNNPELLPIASLVMIGIVFFIARKILK